MRKLVYFSTDHPRLVIIATTALTIVFALAFLRIQIDTDPESTFLRQWDRNDSVYVSVRFDF
jgi:predicted RND superfamily exporter protein